MEHIILLYTLDFERTIIKMNKKKAYFINVIFILMTCCSYIVWPVLKNNLEGENKENRLLAEMPTFSSEAFWDYPSKLESYINDHIPFRDKMIEINSFLNYYLLNTSTNDAVIIGKEDWLFYNANSSMDLYSGRKLYSDEELKTIAYNMQLTKNNLEKKGIKFVLFIAPNRERIYSEYMPSYYGKPSEVNALDQVIDYLNDNTDVTVVCPYNELIKAKKDKPEYILYHKTDTHWNDLGAYIGTKVLFDELGVIWDDSHISIEKVKDSPGDMANLLNLGDVIETGDTYIVSGFQKEDTRTVGEQEFSGHLSFESPSSENGRILIHRDSFCSAMSQYIKEAFVYSDMMHQDNFSNDLIEEDNPDYYVYEIVERNMDQLLTYSYTTSDE